MFQSIRRDSIVSFLSERSSLTEAQIDTIIAAGTGGNLDSKCALRDKKRVSQGAFIRTLSQGRSNIESSLYTLFLLQYLGIMKTESWEGLARLGLLMSELKDQPHDQESVRRVIDALREFVEGFSSRRKLIV